MPYAGCLCSRISDRGGAGDRVADEDRLDEAELIVAIGHRVGIDVARGLSDADAENQRAVRNAPFKGLGLAPLRIHVVGVEITRLPGVHDDVRLGDRAAGGCGVV